MRFLLALAVLASCASADRSTADRPAEPPAGPLPPGAYHVLPASQAEAAGLQCSRVAPEVEAGWAMTDADAQAVERRLPALADAPPADTNPVRADSRIDLGASIRQYVGVVVAGQRVIYVNAFPAYVLDDNDRRDPAHRFHPDRRVVVFCDGGDGFWGVVFDPATGAFSGLDFNGEA